MTKLRNKIPSLEELKSDKMTVNLDNLDFAPPAITNQWSFVVAGRDIFSYAGFAAPPIYSDGVHAQIVITVDGERKIGEELEVPHSYTWHVGRIERSCQWRGLNFETTTALSTRADAVLNKLVIENTTEAVKRIELQCRFQQDLRTDWSGKSHCVTTYDPDRGVLHMYEEATEASAMIGSSTKPARAEISADEQVATLYYEAQIEGKSSFHLELVHVLSGSPGEARAALRDHLRSFRACYLETQQAWTEEWEMAFTPGNKRFSGHLPILTTDENKLKRLYYMSVLTLLCAKRTRRFGTRAMAYATGFPSSALTFSVTSSFLWDAMMVSGLFSMLDPEFLKDQLEDWLYADIHKGYGMDFLTEKPLGFWYAVNDYAFIHMVYQYLRYTGDYSWLAKQVRGRRIFDHLVESADYWQHLASEDGLADYGEKENLLECVSTYTHKVASFNAANVWNARTVALFADYLGEAETASRLRKQADDLARAVNTLYVEGEGYFHAKQPDGSMIPVRHCLDFFTVMQCMGEDLKPEQKGEMLDFFRRELKTTTWMHALSPLDPDSAFSSRTDHQDDGAYTTWPAYCLEVLIEQGLIEEALQWIGLGELPGLADVTRQGPFGQAYHHGDDDSPTICGAGAKAPMEWPHIEKPVLISGGKYAQVLIEYLAGVQPVFAGPVNFAEVELPFALALENISLRGQNIRRVVDPN